MVKKSKITISPLVATSLLVLLSIVVGAVAIAMGEPYFEENAEFTRSGAEEVRAGCTAVDLQVTKVSGVEVACVKNDKGIIDISLDNGPNIDIIDLHAKVLGSQNAQNFQTLLKEPLRRADGIRLILHYNKDLGNIEQVKITPKVIVSGSLVYCKDKALIFDKIKHC